MAQPEKGEIKVACAFCGTGVDYTETDPIALGIVERWRPYDERPNRTFYAHRACFGAELHREARELFDKP
jgi:hypothetical protein